MLVSEVLQNSMKPLSLETGLDGVFIEDFPEGTHLVPVLKGQVFAGFLPLEDLEMEKEINETVGQCVLEKTDLSVKKEQHIFEVLPLFRKAGIPVLPVLDEDANFEGVVKQDSVLSMIADSFSFQTEGGIIVISVAALSYTLSEISRLIESNEAKILSVLVETDPYTHLNLLVHLKINLADLSRIIATLERFDYQIVEVHHKTERSSLDQERLDQLMKYLGI
jgi:acetoin utilization protein AcuB